VVVVVGMRRAEGRVIYEEVAVENEEKKEGVREEEVEEEEGEEEGHADVPVSSRMDNMTRPLSCSESPSANANTCPASSLPKTADLVNAPMNAGSLLHASP